MYNAFPQTVTPGIKSQFDAQFALMSELANQWLHGFMKINALNMQTASTLLEESLDSSRQLLAPENRNALPALLAVQNPPAAEKIRSYQRHMQNIMAETQAGIAKTCVSYMPQAMQLGQAMMQGVAQKTSESTVNAAQDSQVTTNNLVG